MTKDQLLAEARRELAEGREKRDFSQIGLFRLAGIVEKLIAAIEKPEKEGSQ